MADAKTIDAIIAALGALKEPVPSATPQQPAPAQPATVPNGQAPPVNAENAEVEHNIVERDGVGVCTGCGKKFASIRGAQDAINILNKDFHTKHDFLNCPTCRPAFGDAMKANGYDVDDNGTKITIYNKDEE